jgi:putative endonuclease
MLRRRGRAGKGERQGRDGGGVGAILGKALQHLRRKLFPWDPAWQPRGRERRVELPKRGARAVRARRAEEAVARQLWLRGGKIVARNVRNRYGELDIVAVVRGRLTVVEVRSYSEGNPRPAACLPVAKRRSLLRAARRFREERPELGPLGLNILLAEVCFGAGDRPRSIKFVPLDYSDMRWL